MSRIRSFFQKSISLTLAFLLLFSGLPGIFGSDFPSGIVTAYAGPTGTGTGSGGQPVTIELHQMLTGENSVTGNSDPSKLGNVTVGGIKYALIGDQPLWAELGCIPLADQVPGLSSRWLYCKAGPKVTISATVTYPDGTTSDVVLTCDAPRTKLDGTGKTTIISGTFECDKGIVFTKALNQPMKGVPSTRPEECTGEVEEGEEPPPPGYVQPNKYSAAPQFNTGNENYDLAGAEYMCMPGDPSSAETTGGDRVWHGNSRDAYSEFVEFTVDPAGPFTLEETSPPKGFAGNDEVVEDEVAPDEHKVVEFYNEPYRSPVKLLLIKHDREYEFDITDPDEREKYDDDSKNVQGDGMLSGAEFEVHVYCNRGEFVGGQTPIIAFKVRSKDVVGKDQAILDFAYSDVYDFVNNADNSFTKDDYFVDNSDAFSFPLGYVVVTEIKSPVGYTLEDPNRTYVIDTKNPNSVIVGPQFAFEVTTEGAILSGGNPGPNTTESPDGDSIELEYADPAEFDALVKATEKESESQIEIAVKYTKKRYYTIRPNGTVDVHICLPKYESYDMDANIVDYVRITKTGFVPYNGWAREYGKAPAVFKASYDAAGNVVDIAFPSEAQINAWFGSEFDYVIQGTVDAFDFNSTTKTYKKRGTKKANAKTITVNGGAPAIRFEAHSVKYGDQTYPGVYYFLNKDNIKIYLTARPNGWLTENGMKDANCTVPEEWGGIPFYPWKADETPVSSLSASNISQIQVFRKRVHQQQNIVPGESQAGLASGPYIIEYEHDFHVFEQIIRGDVQIEKFDYEKHGPEATGASQKSNELIDGMDTNYAGTHLNGITFNIYNVSNHPAVRMTDHTVIEPNELFTQITTHWNEQMQTYTAETTNGMLPYGTYAIREYSADAHQTYYLSDPQARIFEIRENGRLMFTTEANQSKRSQWVATWSNEPETWENYNHPHSIQAWLKSPYDSSRYDSVINDTRTDPDNPNKTGDNGKDPTRSWQYNGGPSLRSDWHDNYATLTPRSAQYEKRVVSTGWKTNDDSTASNEIRDSKREMIFHNFVSRADFRLKKVRSTLDGDAPVSTLFIITNQTTGEQHIIVTDENGEYSSAPTNSGTSFQDHQVNTNSLDVLMPIIIENRATDKPLRLWPDTLTRNGEYGQIPAQLCDIDPNSGTWRWNFHEIGGLWFGKGENGTYTSFVLDRSGYDLTEMADLLDVVNEQAENRWLDLGHTQLLSEDDKDKMVGIPTHGVILDYPYTDDISWNVKKVASTLVNGFNTTTTPRGVTDSLNFLRNTDADTTRGSGGRTVTFYRAAPDLRTWTRTWLDESLGKLLKNGGHSHTALNNMDGKSQPNGQTKDDSTVSGGGTKYANGVKEGTNHIDGWHIDVRKVDMAEHVFGALPYGKYRLQEVRTTNNDMDHLLDYTFDIQSGGTTKDLGTIQDKLIDAKISTQAIDAASQTQTMLAMDNVQITDTVRYEGLSTSGWYTLTGTLHDLTTGNPVTYENGDPVTSVTTFRPTLQNGITTVRFGLRTNAQAKQYESWEHAYDAVRRLYENGKTNAEVASAEVPNPLGGYKTVYYVIDKITGEPMEHGDNIISGRVLNLENYRGHKIVVLETCKDVQNDEIVAEHVDYFDEYQTIYLPEMESEASPVLLGDTKVYDYIKFKNLKYVDDYSYVVLSGIAKQNGQLLTKSDLTMSDNLNFLHGGSGQLLELGGNVKVYSRFYTDRALPAGNYWLQTELTDKATGELLYDRYNPDGTLVYATKSGYPVLWVHEITNYATGAERVFKAVVNERTQQYMPWPESESGNVSWEGFSSNMYWYSYDYATSDMTDQYGQTIKKQDVELVSKPCRTIAKMTHRELESPTNTVFTIDTSTMAGKEIMALNKLYTTNGATFSYTMTGNKKGYSSVNEPEIAWPAANTIYNMATAVNITFADTEQPERGILAKATHYTLTASLVDSSGTPLRDRYDNPVTWQYSNGTQGVGVPTTFYSPREGVADVTIELLTGNAAIGADHIFNNGNLSIQVLAKRDGIREIEVARQPVNIQQFGGTEFNTVNNEYDMSGVRWSDVWHRELDYFDNTAMGNGYPPREKRKGEWKDNWQKADPTSGPDFWHFVARQENYSDLGQYEGILRKRGSYFYTLADYVPRDDDYNRLNTVTVDNTGSLTGAAFMPFLMEAKGEAIHDYAACSGLVEGEDYTLKVALYNNGTLERTIYKPFMAKARAQLVEAVFYPVDASTVTGAAAKGPYTVVEEVRKGLVNADTPFDSLPADTARVGNYSTKSLEVVRNVQFTPGENGTWQTEAFGKKYDDYFIKATRVFPGENNEAELSISFPVDYKYVDTSRFNNLVFVNSMYTMDRLGAISLSDDHSDLLNFAETLFRSKMDSGMGTVAHVGGEKWVLPGNTITITDSVQYWGLFPKRPDGSTPDDRMNNAILIAEVVLKSTGQIVASTQKQIMLDPTGTGVATIDIIVDTSRFAQGDELVVYETLTTLTGEVIGEHKDITDRGQTIMLYTPTTEVPSDKHIGTKATVGGAKVIMPGQVITVSDEVAYHDFIEEALTKVRLRGQVVLKSTGQVLATAEKEFLIDSSGDGVEVLEFEVDTRGINKGDAIVCYEELVDLNGKVLAVHEDINDDGQTVYFGETPPPDTPDTPITPEPVKSMGTKATVGGSKKTYDVTNATSTTTFTLNDVITYTGYEPNLRVTVSGSVVDKDSGDIVAEATKSFMTSSTGSGQFKLEFTIKAKSLKAGDRLVVFEEMYDMSGNLIGEHKDLSDKDQTITITKNDIPDTPENPPDVPGTPTKPTPPTTPTNPKVPIYPNTPTKPNTPPNTPTTPTTPTNPYVPTTNTPPDTSTPGIRTTATSGGSKFAAPNGMITVTDVVEYWGLPQGSYTMIGYLVRKSNGNVVVGTDGKPISARRDFTANGSGSVTLTFTFDASAFPVGDAVVAFENLLDSTGGIVATHQDISDAGQTVDFKGYQDVPTGVPVENPMAFMAGLGFGSMALAMAAGSISASYGRRKD